LNDFEEIYRAFKYLLDNNKVAEFGVSNYTPIQFFSLNKFLNKRGIYLVTNQIELNNFSSEHYDNDNIFFLKGEEINPMIWSPMGGGQLFEDNEISKGIEKIADKYNTSKENIVISFLHNQGLNPCTILGSHKIQRYEDAIDALELQITQEEKYKMIKFFTKKDIR
ncbi:MAG: aldo/keto reductase, partial [Mycoplasmatales bacterium]